jgi:hypothetical protein
MSAPTAARTTKRTQIAVGVTTRKRFGPNTVIVACSLAALAVAVVLMLQG